MIDDEDVGLIGKMLVILRDKWQLSSEKTSEQAKKCLLKQQIYEGSKKHAN